jgi:hypothetical protein
MDRLFPQRGQIGPLGGGGGQTRVKRSPARWGRGGRFAPLEAGGPPSVLPEIAFRGVARRDVGEEIERGQPGSKGPRHERPRGMAWRHRRPVLPDRYSLAPLPLRFTLRFCNKVVTMRGQKGVAAGRRPLRRRSARGGDGGHRRYGAAGAASSTRDTFTTKYWVSPKIRDGDSPVLMVCHRHRRPMDLLDANRGGGVADREFKNFGHGARQVDHGQLAFPGFENPAPFRKLLHVTRPLALGIHIRQGPPRPKGQTKTREQYAQDRPLDDEPFGAGQQRRARWNRRRRGGCNRGGGLGHGITLSAF